ncbi:protein zntA-like [Montipora capricornis]|uniref:protein zntA-like n=1 Tax=Montipora capricornis TaxID=246305 RepID=UPI0035F1A39E
MYKPKRSIVNKAQEFQYEREVCPPSVWLGNLEIDETTDQETADIIQQVSKEDPEYSLARGHFRQRTMGKDKSESHRRKHQEKKVEMDRVYAKPVNNITRSALEWNPQEAAQGNPGGGVCKMSSPRRISLDDINNYNSNNDNNNINDDDDDNTNVEVDDNNDNNDHNDDDYDDNNDDDYHNDDDDYDDHNENDDDDVDNTNVEVDDNNDDDDDDDDDNNDDNDDDDHNEDDDNDEVEDNADDHNEDDDDTIQKFT